MEVEPLCLEKWLPIVLVVAAAAVGNQTLFEQSECIQAMTITFSFWLVY